MYRALRAGAAVVGAGDDEEVRYAGALSSRRVGGGARVLAQPEAFAVLWRRCVRDPTVTPRSPETHSVVLRSGCRI